MSFLTPTVSHSVTRREIDRSLLDIYQEINLALIILVIYLK